MVPATTEHSWQAISLPCILVRPSPEKTSAIYGSFPRIFAQWVSSWCSEPLPVTRQCRSLSHCSSVRLLASNRLIDLVLRRFVHMSHWCDVEKKSHSLSSIRIVERLRWSCLWSWKAKGKKRHADPFDARWFCASRRNRSYRHYCDDDS